MLALGSLPRGALVGVARLKGVVRLNRSNWYEVMAGRAVAEVLPLPEHSRIRPLVASRHGVGPLAR